MSEVKHTPGRRLISGPFNRRYQVDAVHERGLLPVAECESLGDAHLIAAAPEMLEALKELVEILDDPDARRDTDSFTSQPARAAIAKAEGRS